MSEDDIIDIHVSYAAGICTRKNLADRYHVSQRQIGAILCGEQYLLIGRDNMPVIQKHQNKLTADDARAICAASDIGETQMSIAGRFGVSGARVNQVINGFAWREATGRICQRHNPYHPSKLTGEKVRAIRIAYAKGDVTQGEIAIRYGVSQSLISNIILGIAHLESDDETKDDYFWRKVDRTGGSSACWEWQGSIKAGKGYGIVKRSGSIISAHRCAYEMINGKIAPGITLRQTCRNPRCVNPAHMQEKTRRVQGVD